MPYINKVERIPIDKHVDQLVHIINDSPGAMNYAVTKLIHGYLEDHGLCYVNLNAMIGVLECAKQELYRIIGGPYENTKIRDNGCISGLDLNAVLRRL